MAMAMANRMNLTIFEGRAECHYTVHTRTYQGYHLLWGHIEADSSEVHLAVVVHAGDDEEYTGTLRPACTRRTQTYS